MAPHAIEPVVDAATAYADLKAKVVVDSVEVQIEPKPPLADNYMYDFAYNHALPTSRTLGIEIPADCNAPKEAASIVARLANVMGEGNAQGFADLFLDYGEQVAYAKTVLTYFPHRCLA